MATSWPQNLKYDDDFIRTNRNSLLQSCIDLTQCARAYKNGTASQKELQKAIEQTRLRYKALEFLLEYFYPSYVEAHINGAPLFHAEANETRPDVSPPEGLQVLDELCFSQKPSSSEIEILSQSLLTHMKQVTSGLEQRQINDPQIIEACRLQVLRVFTMGITGFDTPGSLNGLTEAIVSLETVKTVVQSYNQAPTKDVVEELTNLLNNSIEYLAIHSDFDTFDRLEFLRTFINPIYDKLHSLRMELGPEYMNNKPSARNPESRGLFSMDFLNPYFFTELKKTEDNTALRKLGEQLFYDPKISHNQKMSCGSCHNPQKGFADGVPKSASNVEGHKVDRNAPTMLNAVYADRYFYDLRAFTLEQQAEHVIFNDNEFNTAYDEILAKLNSDESYQKRFQQVFGTNRVSKAMFSKALASYVLSLQSFNSRFDKYARGETDTIDKQVVLGFNLFMGKAACATCHFAPTFSGLVPPRFTKNESEILGVFESPHTIMKSVDHDMGRFDNAIASEQAWIYERSFKTTTVRNVELTSPYFHNGAFARLLDVVNFYDKGGAGGVGVEVKNQTLSSDPLELNETEKDALVQFMISLTDTTSYKGKQPSF